MLPEIVAVQSQDKQHRRLWSKIKSLLLGVSCSRLRRDLPDLFSEIPKTAGLSSI